MKIRNSLVVLGLALAGLYSAQAAEKVKTLYQTHRLSVGDVAISCADGSKPVAQAINNGNFVLVSCPIGRENVKIQ
jgi:hypothetical protein